MSVEFSIAFGQFPFGLPRAAWFAALVKQAEALGFAALWHGERPLTANGMHSPVALLGYLAAVTDRIKLGSSVLVLPLHHPAHVAKAAATLDQLSEGRFVLGIGPGGDFADEFESFGIPIKERGGRTMESIDVMRRLWREDAVDFDGRYYRVKGSVWPRPFHPDGPPVWVGGRGDWAIRCAGQLGDGWCPSFMTPSRFSQSWSRLREIAEANGRNPAKITPAVHITCFIGRTFEEAYPVAARFMSTCYGRPYEPAFLRKVAAVGSPENCRETILGLVDAGVRHVLLMPACPTEQMPDQLAAAASELLQIA